MSWLIILILNCMKGTPRERAGVSGEARAVRRKEPSTSVNNIRESSYKIVRSRSNRTDHSLSTKKPLLITPHSTSLSKQRLERFRETPQTPIHPRTTGKQPRTAETYAPLYETVVLESRTPNRLASQEGKEESSFKNESKEALGPSSEFDCLQAIWENTKTLKASGLFASEIQELESILERMVFKLAQQENCLTARDSAPTVPLSHPQKLRRHQLKATCDTEEAFSGRVQELFEQRKIPQSCKIHYANEGRESVKSSYGSLRIENEDSHKLEYLNIYAEGGEAEGDVGTGMLRDITNSCRLDSQQSQSHSLSSNSNNGKVDTFRREEKPQWEDRVYLRNIVKRSKPIEAKPTESKPTVQDCCEKERVSSMNMSFQCHLFDCEGGSRKEASSAGSSESKREVLNQIICMLNRKYQRGISGKVLI